MTTEVTDREEEASSESVKQLVAVVIWMLSLSRKSRATLASRCPLPFLPSTNQCDNDAAQLVRLDATGRNNNDAVTDRHVLPSACQWSFPTG